MAVNQFISTAFNKFRLGVGFGLEFVLSAAGCQSVRVEIYEIGNVHDILMSSVVLR